MLREQHTVCRRRAPSLSLTLGLLWLIGCGSAPVVLKHSAGTPAYYPFSRQVSFIESSTTGETMLRVAGRGHDVPSAMADARKAGLWYLFYAGDRPFFKQDMGSQGFGDIERQLFLSHADFIRYESGLKSKKRLAGETRIQMVVRYDVAALKNRLSRSGALASTDAVAETVGLPSIGVIGATASKANQTAIATMREYLQDRQFEVFDLSNKVIQDRAISQLARLEGVIDPSFGSALESATDILIRVDASIATGRVGRMATAQGAVSIAAFDVASGSSLGSSTGRSPARVGLTDPNNAAAEAANDAADKITQQLLSSWRRQGKVGRAFKVVLMSPLDSANQMDATMYDSLRRVAKAGRPIRRTGSGQGISSYILYADSKVYPNAFELFGAIKRAWAGTNQLTKVKDAGGLLILKVDAGAPGIEL
ncbi:MAG: DUF6175 family protein [Bradymonadia bacterium]